jgi:FdhE protein
MVPSGSREALSGPSNPPPQGYGESTLGEVAHSDPIRLPDLSTIFGRRAARLKALAEGHELQGFLHMIGAIVAAQEVALRALPPGSLPGAAEMAKAKLVGRAPLDPELWKRDRSWRAALASILEGVDRTALPGPAREACEALEKASEGDLEGLADRFLQGAVASGEAGKAVLVAAALQVAWTRMAALLDVADLGGSDGDQGTCPACGSPPVAGIVSPGGTKFGHRHRHCSLCATAWRYVRVRCVHCGSTEKISFRNLAGTTYLRAECCESCQGYSKVFYLESMKALEALADDLGSLGLDVLVGEEGFARVPNPFVLDVMEQPEGRTGPALPRNN